MISNRLRIALLSIRILLGVLFLLSGIGKLIESGDARFLVELMATEFYWLIEYADAIVIGTSVIELVLGGLLLWGKKLKSVFTASFLLLMSFTAVLGYFWIQGQSVESCGCFGAFGIGGGLEITLIRNGILIVLVVAGFVLKKRNVSSNR